MSAVEFIPAPAYVKVDVIRYEDKPFAIGFYFEAEDGTDLYAQQIVDALVDYLLGEGAEFVNRRKKEMH